MWPGRAGAGGGERKLLCHAPRGGALRPDPGQAPRPVALPGEGDPRRGCGQREARTMSDVRAAVAAAALGSEEGHREVLAGVVETARAIFQAKASSVLLLDEPAGELVFAAVSGEGETELVGRRIPVGTGIAGFTLVSRQPLVLDDVAEDPRFSRQAAESTGYVPRALMSVPLLRGQRAIGGSRFSTGLPSVSAFGRWTCLGSLPFRRLRPSTCWREHGGRGRSCRRRGATAGCRPYRGGGRGALWQAWRGSRAFARCPRRCARGARLDLARRTNKDKGPSRGRPLEQRCVLAASGCRSSGRRSERSCGWSGS